MDRSALSNRNIMQSTYVILYFLVVTLKDKRETGKIVLIIFFILSNTFHPINTFNILSGLVIK